MKLILKKISQAIVNPLRWNINEGGGLAIRIAVLSSDNRKSKEYAAITGEKEQSTSGNTVRANHNQGNSADTDLELKPNFRPAKNGYALDDARNSRYGPWPSCGEIDIMESLGHFPALFYGTIHFGKPHSEAGVRYIIPDFDPERFYTFKLLWEEKEIKWYVDDFLIGGVNTWFTNHGKYPAPFDQPFFLIVNLAIGGRFPGNPDETTVFPGKFIVDYIKVYQRNGGD